MRRPIDEKKFELTRPGVSDVLFDYPELLTLGGDE